MTDILFGGLRSVSPGANAGAPGAGELPTLKVGADAYDGGVYYVGGTVGIDSTPDIMVHRRVRLICRQSGRLVRETWSDPITGAYRFEHVRIGPWTVLSHDYTDSYNAVVADNILGIAE